MSEWIKSSYCAADKPQCVEVAHVGAFIKIRNSRMPHIKVSFTADEWAAFVAGVKAGEFD